MSRDLERIKELQAIIRDKHECSIKDIIDFGDVLVIRLWNTLFDGDMTKQPSNNLYAINKKGKILWRVKDIIRVNQRGSDTCVVSCKQEDNYLVFNTFICMRYVVKPNSGEVISTISTK